MFSRLGFAEIALILAVVLLLFGAAKLPQLGKAVGETMKEFKRAVSRDEPASEDPKPDNDKA